VFYSGEVFRYYECDVCGSAALADVPHDLGRYYPDDYYSFSPAEGGDPQSVLTRMLRHVVVRAALLNPATARATSALSARAGAPIEPWVRLLAGLHLNRRTPILDVGCGSGHRLRTLRRFGFDNLTGIDAHLPVPPTGTGSDGDLRLLKGAITELTDLFDVIMFHHSLEHMAEPAHVLRAANEILSPGGVVIVRVPLAQSFAWRVYGTEWVQWDAPRHHFLFSPNGLRLLASRCDLAVRKIVYDSNDFQFWGSELHRRRIPVRQGGPDAGPPASLFPQEELARYQRRARELNAKSDGDQAAFLLARASDD